MCLAMTMTCQIFIISFNQLIDCRVAHCGGGGVPALDLRGRLELLVATSTSSSRLLRSPLLHVAELKLINYL
jgi:hypothetical protein